MNPKTLCIQLFKPASRTLAAAALGVAFIGGVQAEGLQAPGSGPWNTDSPRLITFQLAQAATPTASPTATTEKKTRELETFQPVDAPWYGRNNVHKYLGLASIASAALTIVSPKSMSGPHEMFAEAAAALGGAAVVTGAYAHWDDVDFKWSDPDTKHAILGVLGTLGYAVAVSRGGEGGHAGAGALGALSMIAAIKYTW